jgi:archaellum component FlaG (FlaF/FlaG flagellin family)
VPILYIKNTGKTKVPILYIKDTGKTKVPIFTQRTRSVRA